MIGASIIQQLLSSVVHITTATITPIVDDDMMSMKYDNAILPMLTMLIRKRGCYRDYRERGRCLIERLLLLLSVTEEAAV